MTSAYPKARSYVLDSYIQDSVCGTWEKLADAVYPGGSEALKKTGWPKMGQAKCEWAGRIENNFSRSFQAFRNGMRRLAEKRKNKI
ncbi:hypothetical protein QUF80_06575 [Desulfococcaceae bacterium HSG8]|nr:hypothetical protein [Desulfococcaceae bacterium HSG8]